MTGAIRSTAKWIRRSLPLSRVRGRMPSGARPIHDSSVSGQGRAGVIVVREYCRDPSELTYTFAPRLRVAEPVDVVELLDRCDDSDLVLRPGP